MRPPIELTLTFMLLVLSGCPPPKKASLSGEPNVPGTLQFNVDAIALTRSSRRYCHSDIFSFLHVDSLGFYLLEDLSSAQLVVAGI